MEQLLGWRDLATGIAHVLDGEAGPDGPARGLRAAWDDVVLGSLAR